MNAFGWIVTLLPIALLSGSPVTAESHKVVRAAAPAAPAPGGLTVATGHYEFVFAGISLGFSTYEGRFEGDRYKVSSHFETSGVVSAFWQARIDASASGLYNPRGVKPSAYDSFYRQGSKKHQRVAIAFDGPSPVTTADPPYDMTANPVTDEQKKSGVDPLSALTLVLLGATADARNPCGTGAPVFDGRRRYNLELQYLRDEPVKLGGTGYEGPAHLCQIRYKQIAGYDQRVVRRGGIPDVYAYVVEMADPSAPNGRYLVPLKVWARTSWGTVEAKLTGHQIEKGADKSS